MCGIYVITNNINNKKYIGKSFDVNRRLRHHQIDTFNPNSAEYNSVIHRAIRKHGIENFSFNVLELCDENDLDSREMYWINKYETYGKGYNMTLGGQGAPLIDRRLIYNLWDEGKSIGQISEFVKTEKHTVVIALKGYKNYSREESLKRGYTIAGCKNCKPIAQYSPEGELLCTYKSIKDAAKELNIKTSAISSCLIGKQKSTNKFIWKYIEPNVEPEHMLSNATYSRKGYSREVIQLDKVTEEVVASYPTMSAAAKAVGIRNLNSLVVACKNPSRTAYGYKWRYVEGDKNAH